MNSCKNQTKEDLPIWLTPKQTAEIIQWAPASLSRYLAEGRISEKCVKKIGKHWRFRREVVLEHGLIFTGEEDELTTK